MSIPIWPFDLPQFVLVSGFGVTQADGRLRTPTDTGPGKLRLSNSGAVMSVRVELPPLDPNGVARFNRFWNEEIGFGVLPFLIHDPILDGVPLSDDTDSILTDNFDQILLNTAWWLVRFVGAPTKTAVGGFWFPHQFVLEVLS